MSAKQPARAAAAIDEQQDPDQLVSVYGRIRLADKRALEAWAKSRGLTFSQALALAVPKGTDFLQTWGA